MTDDKPETTLDHATLRAVMAALKDRRPLGSPDYAQNAVRELCPAAFAPKRVPVVRKVNGVEARFRRKSDGTLERAQTPFRATTGERLLIVGAFTLPESFFVAGHAVLDAAGPDTPTCDGCEVQDDE